MIIKRDSELNELVNRKDNEAVWDESDSGWSSANADQDSSWEIADRIRDAFECGIRLAERAGKKKVSTVFCVSDDIGDCWYFFGTKEQVRKRILALPDKEEDE